VHSKAWHRPAQRSENCRKGMLRTAGLLMDLGIKNALVVYFHGEFFRAAPAACSFIPLRPKARNSVAHTEAPGHMSRKGGLGLGRCRPVHRNSRFPQLFPRFGQKFSGLVPTGIRRQIIDKTREISEEPASSDAASNVFPLIVPVHGNSSDAGILELTRGRRGSARSPRRCPKAPNRPARRGAWWLRNRIRQRRACR
jgi:hypothetical protein